jgi:hypothetical protein
VLQRRRVEAQLHALEHPLHLVRVGDVAVIKLDIAAPRPLVLEVEQPALVVVHNADARGLVAQEMIYQFTADRADTACYNDLAVTEVT